MEMLALDHRALKDRALGDLLGMRDEPGELGELIAMELDAA